MCVHTMHARSGSGVVTIKKNEQYPQKTTNDDGQRENDANKRLAEAITKRLYFTPSGALWGKRNGQTRRSPTTTTTTSTTLLTVHTPCVSNPCLHLTLEPAKYPPADKGPPVVSVFFCRGEEGKQASTLINTKLLCCVVCFGSGVSKRSVVDVADFSGYKGIKSQGSFSCCYCF